MSRPTKHPPWQIVEADMIGAVSGDGSPPPAAGEEIAFAGRSNVGKSSLMNALCERKHLVRTSSTPGCTRQVNFFGVRARDDRSFVLVDLPGYGYAKRSKEERIVWGRLIERYLRGRAALRLVVVLVDARRGLSGDDEQLIAFLEQARAVGEREGGPPEIVVAATKLDKVPRSKQRATLGAIERSLSKPVVGCSAHDGTGIAQLWQLIRARVGTDPPPAAEQPVDA